LRVLGKLITENKKEVSKLSKNNNNNNNNNNNFGSNILALVA
jgi:hypothetical protein